MAKLPKLGSIESCPKCNQATGTSPVTVEDSGDFRFHREIVPGYEDYYEAIIRVCGWCGYTWHESCADAE